MYCNLQITTKFLIVLSCQKFAWPFFTVVNFTAVEKSYGRDEADFFVPLEIIQGYLFFNTVIF